MLEEMFRETFLAELEEIVQKENFTEPNAEIRGDDNIVGEMNELERAVYTLATHKAKLSEMLGTKIKFENQPADEKERMMYLFYELSKQSEALRELMWVLIGERFGLSDKSTGIRKGFRIVRLEETSPLKTLMGESD